MAEPALTAARLAAFSTETEAAWGLTSLPQQRRIVLLLDRCKAKPSGKRVLLEHVPRCRRCLSQCGGAILGAFLDEHRVEPVGRTPFA